MGSLSVGYQLIILLTVRPIFGTTGLRNLDAELGGALRGFRKGTGGCGDKPDHRSTC